MSKAPTKAELIRLYESLDPVTRRMMLHGIRAMAVCGATEESNSAWLSAVAAEMPENLDRVTTIICTVGAS